MPTHKMKPKPMRAATAYSDQIISEACQLETWMGVPLKRGADGQRLYWQSLQAAGIVESIPCEPSWRPSGPNWGPNFPA
jgi:hypothetical protein